MVRNTLQTYLRSFVLLGIMVNPRHSLFGTGGGHRHAAADGCTLGARAWACAPSGTPRSTSQSLSRPSCSCTVLLEIVVNPRRCSICINAGRRRFRRAPHPALECPGGCSATAQVVQSSPGGAYRRVARGPWRAYTRGSAKGFLKNGAAALMREANEIGSGSGACARQGRGVRRRSAPIRSCSSLGFGLLEENRRAVQRFARLCS